jgi:Uma2 family endonuclease
MVSIEEGPKLQGSPKKKFTLQQYLQKERSAAEKHEFFNGKITAMPGGSYNHNKIATNLLGLIDKWIDAESQDLIVLNSDQKIFIPQENIVLYPDALVIFDRPVFWENNDDLLINPLVIVEVLSKSTARYDRGEKFMLYQHLDSLKEYVLIDQNQAQAEIWYRIAENTWQKNHFSGMEQSLELRSIGLSMKFSEVYKKS